MDKQIEEIYGILLNGCNGIDCYECEGNGKKDGCLHYHNANEIYNAGYRKASDLAREIFEELLKDITRGLAIARCTRTKFLHNTEKNNIWVYHYDGEIKALEGMECLIAELKNKFTEEK